MSLAQHLARQTATVDRLVELLVSEAKLLGDSQIDGERLTALAADKQVLLAALDQLETQRRTAQQRLGYGDDQAGAARAAADAGCSAAWERLIEQARRARTLNEQNGGFIRSRMECNQRIINFLHEAAGRGLYGPDGQSRLGSLAGIDSRA